MERKHFYLGGALLGLLAVAAVGFTLATSSAQTAGCVNNTYSISPTASPPIMDVYVPYPGAAGSITEHLILNSYCMNEIVNVNVVDSVTQAAWPGCTVNPPSVNINAGLVGQPATPVVISCTPANTTDTPTVRFMRGTETLFSFGLRFGFGSSTPPSTQNPVACTGMNLSVTPASVTRTNDYSGPVELAYNCYSPANGTVNSLTIQVCPPDSPTNPCQTLTTLNNVSAGTYSFPTNSYTQSGSYMVRTCMNDSACGMSSTNSTSFSLAAGSTTPPPTSGTQCSAGQVWCPVVAGSNAAAGCYTTCPTATTSTGCQIGQTCSSNSWCESGQRCFTTSGQLQCVAWGSACPAGTKYCNPNESTNCLEPGATGTGTSFWCAGSSSKCYRKNSANDEFMCQLNTGGTGAAMSMMGPCPTGYTHCSPTDTNCRDIGETGPSSAWCWSGNKCNLTDGTIKCVQMGEACPAGAKLCSSTDTNCVEPGEYASYTGTMVSKWCVGGSLQLYSSDQMYCYPRTQVQMSDPSWYPTVPAGFRFCRPSDNYCREPGQIAQSGEWCAWMPPIAGAVASSGTTRTCPSIPGYTPSGGTTVTPPATTTCSNGQIWCPAVAGSNMPAGCYTTCPTAVTTPPTCSAGQTICYPSAGGAGYCAATCPVTVPTCPTMPTVTACPSGQVLRTRTTADGCSSSYCETEFVPTPYDQLPECREGEGFGPGTGMGPSCRMPNYCWQNGAFAKQASNYTAPAPANGMNLCGSFRPEELEYRTLWAKRWDPAKYGIWHWPSYPDGTPTFKYDPSTDSLLSCKMGDMPPPYATTTGITQYYSPCQMMTEADKPLWLVRFRTEKKMHDMWQTKPPVITPREEPIFCAQVISYALDPGTNACKSFPTPCDVPSGWKPVPSCDFQKPICMAVAFNCPPGMRQKLDSAGCPTKECVSEMELPVTPVMPPMQPGGCRQFLRGYYDEVRGYRFFFRDISQQIAHSPERLRQQLGNLTEVLERGKTLAAGAEQKIKDAVSSGKCTPDRLTGIEESLQTLRTEIIPAINEQQESLRVAQECQFFTKGLGERIAGLRKDARREHRADEEFAESILAEVAKLETLKPKAEAACQALDAFALDDVRFELDMINQTIGDLMSQKHEFATTQFIDSRTEGIRNAIAELRGAIVDQNLEENCTNVAEYVNKVESILDEADKLFQEGNEAEASARLASAESFRNIVFDAAKQCGVKVGFLTPKPVMDTRLLFQGVSGLDDAAVEKIIDRVVAKIVDKVTVLVDEKVKNLVAQAQELQDKTLQDLIVGIDNLNRVLKDKQEKLDQLIAEKEKVIAEINTTLKELKTKKGKLLTASYRASVEKALDKAASKVWCGTLGAEVTQKVTLMKNALVSGEISQSDAISFVDFVTDAESRNGGICYEQEISHFKDMSPEQWFFPYFHGPAAVFKGKYAPDGTPLGIVEPGRRALWMEGAVAVARAMSVPNVDGRCAVPPNVAGAVNVPYGACAVDYFVDHNVPLPTHPIDQSMTRAELATLLASLTSGKLPVRGERSHLAKYKDVSFDAPYGPAVATVIANGIMLGKDQTGGFWAPNEVPTRAEIAAVIGRVMELTTLTSGVTQRYMTPQ